MILALDTTTERIHLALVQGGQSWARALPVAQGRSHSAALMPGLRALMAEAGCEPGALEGVVACVGPGGFTALRIGVATAEGLALTGLPTWGFTAFEFRSRALRRGGFLEPAWVLLDGQRAEAFAHYWSHGPRGQACKVPLDQLSGLVQGRPWWSPAPFAPKVQAALGYAPLPLSGAPEEAAALQALQDLGRDLPRRPPESPLVPFYLRETDAELNFPEASAHLPEALRRGQVR